jgi:2-dehydropantoate 2-reductase
MDPSTRGADAPLTWHIIGTGAMACLWAASLAGAGRIVRMRARHPPVGEAYHALEVCSAGAKRQLRVCEEAADAQDAIARVLVCTKAGDVQQAVGALIPRLGAGCAVVLLQNGMGFQQAVAQALPGARVFAAATTEGAWREAPFRVHHAGHGTTSIGRWPRGSLQEAEDIAAALRGDTLAVQAVAEIEPVLWRKLAVNCAINPLTALHGCRNGELLERPALRLAFDDLCTEIAGVLAGLGHAELAAQVGDEARRVARATAANRSSMLQDLSAGRRTEIDWITGCLCRAAHGAGLPCPLNDALLAAVRAREPG